ncbi:hypothetical protein KSD_72260 [Ktedonobacter sp. SOSP1-85]|nr:hypothetical protein KSD_72260 [Ktedonobacter sp. SOSP1-85]
MQAIAIPISVALLAFFGNMITTMFNQAQYANSQRQHQGDVEIAKDQQRETTLQTYFDRMSDLILNDHLKTTKDYDIRNVARTRTLEVLPQLDPHRKGEIVQFLHDTGLINTGSVIVNLSQADLNQAYLKGSDLSNADLENASLVGANLRLAQMNAADLSGANLMGTNLSSARLMKTNLSSADLNGANLQFAQMGAADLGGADLGKINQNYAHLSGANLSHVTGVTTAQLRRAKSLQGTIMPDGSRHP